jgi:hypothetical protein
LFDHTITKPSDRATALLQKVSKFLVKRRNHWNIKSRISFLPHTFG